MSDETIKRLSDVLHRLEKHPDYEYSHSAMRPNGGWEDNNDPEDPYGRPSWRRLLAMKAREDELMKQEGFRKAVTAVRGLRSVIFEARAGWTGEVPETFAIPVPLKVLEAVLDAWTKEFG